MILLKFVRPLEPKSESALTSQHCLGECICTMSPKRKLVTNPAAASMAHAMPDVACHAFSLKASHCHVSGLRSLCQAFHQACDTQSLHLVHGLAGVVVAALLEVAAKDLLLRLPLAHEAVQLLRLHDEGEIGLLLLRLAHGALQEAAGGDEAAPRLAVLASLREPRSPVDAVQCHAGAVHGGFCLSPCRRDRDVGGDDLQHLLAVCPHIAQLDLQGHACLLRLQRQLQVPQVHTEGEVRVDGGGADCLAGSLYAATARAARDAVVVAAEGGATASEDRHFQGCGQGLVGEDDSNFLREARHVNHLDSTAGEIRARAKVLH
mmetsp:Transcript_61452/g.146551  ORF Transcript_61452/g.146551 Transcript_61452/m.146551 type:complete len:320 (+) Transcript_61452:29-988(+)